MTKEVNINNFKISNSLPIILIAGPCQLENREHAIYIAKSIKKICDKLKVNFIFKSSFDKANRTSHLSQRGLGLEKSIKIFEEIRKQMKIPILTDVHTAEQCAKIKNSVDIIQIPAFLCRQTDLLQSAAKTNLVINIKKGQFLAPWDVSNIIRKVKDINKNILLTERGVSFGYNTLISDMRSISIMKKENFPVIFDATHSVQQPGGKGDQSGGQREFIYDLSKAAVSIGIAGLFIEVHDNPDKAPSDGPNMLKLSDLEKFLIKIIKLDNLIKNEKL
ncbi:MAG: 3-deoxy-8-phosphooctulonate synthase [Candidatus Pelagibacter sp.]|nr:3-deoxy-8-phosphooctulonate synthase [Candidatus Pelagibacter sp.]OUV87282.1 MAG: 3-deoxy-8-phosphooctulonate synthase [Pelagibacteraceae bacterium TMED136]|tara:strand:- start:240 stop:1067 length:828 start_codon:yes stop_codon:yes gene_type:complete